MQFGEMRHCKPSAVPELKEHSHLCISSLSSHGQLLAAGSLARNPTTLHSKLLKLQDTTPRVLGQSDRSHNTCTHRGMA